MQNQPYVKIFKDGILINPIIERYDSGNSLRKLKRNKERYVSHKKLKNANKEPILFFQVKTKRGKWNTVKILNN